MKRFITYLYAYEKGYKEKNVGFARIDLRNKMIHLELSLRFQPIRSNVGKVYMLIQQDELIGIEVGEICPCAGKRERPIIFSAEDMLGSGYRFSDVVGIGIQFDADTYLASCIVDGLEKEIGDARFRIWEKTVEQDGVELDNMEEEPRERMEEASIEEVMQKNEKLEETVGETIEEVATEESIVIEEKKMESQVFYKKIDINDIHNLKSSNWYLATNSFLVHGYNNYHYLILKEDYKDGVKTMYLGVPGVFERPEMVMAILFGFEEFEAMDEALRKNNQQHKEGTLGYWLVPLQV